MKISTEKFQVPKESNNILDLSKNNQAPLNHCMYCKSKDNLTDEHIVPFGFVNKGKGNISLKQSSCRDCATITSKFERDVLRGDFLGLRSILDFKSRKGKIPRELPLTVVRNGKEEEVVLPVEEHPIMLTFPIFDIPSELAGSEKTSIILKRQQPVFNFGKPIGEVLKDLDAEDLKIKQTYSTSFPRFIAKIAWGVAIAHGFETRLNDELCYAFMHDDNNLGRWVGTYTDSLEIVDGVLHGVRVREDAKIGYLVADVKLVADSETPVYGVLLGEL